MALYPPGLIIDLLYKQMFIISDRLNTSPFTDPSACFPCSLIALDVRVYGRLRRHTQGDGCLVVLLGGRGTFTISCMMHLARGNSAAHTYLCLTGAMLGNISKCLSKQYNIYVIYSVISSHVSITMLYRYDSFK